MARTPETTVWGSRLGTGAASIDLVLLEAPFPLTVEQIEVEIRRQGLKERGEVARHLYSLRMRGHVTRVASGWVKV
jgi:hypothetical protein